MKADSVCLLAMLILAGVVQHYTVGLSWGLLVVIVGFVACWFYDADSRAKRR